MRNSGVHGPNAKGEERRRNIIRTAAGVLAAEKGDGTASERVEMLVRERSREVAAGQRSGNYYDRNVSMEEGLRRAIALLKP